MASTKRKATGERRLEIVQAARDILISEDFHKLTLGNVANKVESNWRRILLENLNTF